MPPSSSGNSSRRDFRHVSRWTSAYPLSCAVLNQKIGLIELLLKTGAALDNSEADGKTALHLAMESISHFPLLDSRYKQGDASIVELLLRRGANVNVTDATGETVLYKACYMNKLQLATILLQHDADPNITTTEKYPLNAACENNNIEIVKLLLSKGAVANMPQEKTMHSDRQLPLCIAAEKRNIEMMDVLIEHGSDVNQQDNNRETALHLVAESSESRARKCIDLLLKKRSRHKCFIKE